MSCIINRDKDGKITSVTSNTGNPSLLFEKFRSLEVSDDEALNLYAQIHTKSFKEWYGDWENSPLEASQYLDVNGEPMVFFHGTNEKFDKFDPDKKRYSTHDISKGIFFTQEAKHARKYGKNVVPVFLKAETIERTQPTEDMLNRISSLSALRKYESNIINTTKADSVELLTNDKEGIKILQNVIFDPNNILFAKKEDIIPFEERFQKTREFKTIDESVEQGNESDRRSQDEAFKRDLQSSLNIEDENSLDVVKAVADRLAEKTGIDYDVISIEQAKQITKDSENPYTNQAAFFYNGKVYFVDGKISLGTVFHEYSHPFVAALREQNKPLYDKLTSELLGTPEGRALLEESAQEYNSDIEDYRVTDEALVKSIEKSALENNTPEFKSALKKIFYAIRQMLRKIFGKNVKVNKLKTDTTIAELADILKSEYVRIEPFNITNEDYVAYKAKTAAAITNMTDSINNNLDDSQVLLVLNSFYDHVNREIYNLKKTKNIEGLKDLIADVYGKNALEEKRDILKKFETITSNNYDKKLNDLETEVDLTSQRSRAIVNAMIEAETMLELSYPKLQTILKQPEIDLVDLQMINALSQTVDSYQSFIKTLSNYMDDSGFPRNNEFTDLLKSVKGEIDSSQNIIDKINRKGVSKVLIDQTRGIRDQVIEAREALIAEAKDESVKNKYQREIDMLNNMDEDIKSILANNAKDANIMSWLTAPINTKDVILSGYADLIKTVKIKSEIESQKEQNRILSKLEAPLRRIEKNKHFQRVDHIGQAVTYKETKKIINEKGELEDKQVYAFIERFKGYKAATDEMKYNVARSKETWEETGSDEDYKAFIDAKGILEKHKINFFQKPYVDAFYKPKETLLNDVRTIEGKTYKVGESALADRDVLLERITEQSARANMEEDVDQKQKELEITEALWQDYRQLFSLVDAKGNRKEGLALAKAEALKKYRKDSRKFFKYTLREGAFESALAHYEDYLQSIGITEESNPEEYNRLREQWISKNIRKTPNDKYYEDLDKAYSDLSKLLDEANVTNPEAIDKAREDIQDIKAFNKDKNGEVRGFEMKINLIDKVKTLDQRIADIKDNVPGLSGLTPAEQRELTLLEGSDAELSMIEEDRVKELKDKRDNSEISPALRQAIYNQFKKIAEITSKEATTDYLDIMNEFIGSIEGGIAHLQSTMKSEYISKTNANQFLEDGVYRFFLKDEGFKEWFNKAHIKGKKIEESKLGDMTFTNEVDKYTRTSVWSNNVPASNKYLGKIQLKDQEGNTTETIYGQPIFEYYDRDVKDVYKTKKVVGETVDVWGNFLPKSADKMDKSLEGWDRYLNKDYDRLKSENPDMFEVLQILLEAHYKAQEGIEDAAKLGNEIPRFRTDKAETLQKGGLWEKVKLSGKQLRDKVILTKDDAEEMGLNTKNLEKDTTEDVDTYLSLLNEVNPQSALYIRGKFNIDLDLTSLDVISAVMKYMHSANEQKGLMDIHPMAKALQSVIDKTDAKGAEELKKKQGMSLGPITISRGNKDRTTRAKVIQALTEREFYGKKITGMGAKNPGLAKIVNLMTSETARSYLGLNFPSDIKNRFSQTTHNLYTMIHGKDVSPKAFAKGKLFGAQLVADVSRQRYKRGTKSLNMQLLETFDIMEDRFVSKLGEYATSGATRDFVNMTWTTSFRKLMEQEGAFELFGAMLYQQKVEQIGEDGKPVEIPLKEAYELADGQIRLKENITDRGWEIGGEKFINYRKKMQTVLESTAGAYAEFSQGLVDRHSEFKAFIALRKYAYAMWRRRLNGASIDPDINSYWKALQKTAATGERYAGGTFDVGYGEMFTGYYAEAAIGAAVLANGLSKGKINTLTPDEKGAMRVVAAELITTLAIFTAAMMVLGYDDDDSERFKKMRNLSGPLPLPWVEQDSSRPAFNLGGWLHAHAIYQLMLVRGENSQFAPSISGLAELSKFKDGTSVIWGPTIDKFITLGLDLKRGIMGDERGFYKRDIGPFAWQKAESWKFWNHLAQSFYFRGKGADPAKGIKDQSTFENIR